VCATDVEGTELPCFRASGRPAAGVPLRLLSARALGRVKHYYKPRNRETDIQVPVVSEVKVKLPPCLINYAQCHEGVWGSGCIAPPFLTSALDGGEWLASRLGSFTAVPIA
jgi:hypothetical protein